MESDMQNNLDDRASLKGYFPSLVEKSKPLETATNIALMKLGLSYENLTHVYNGKFMKEHYGHRCGYTPDYTIIDSIAIECKAWNIDYRVSKKMIDDKLFRRLEGNWKYKIVIFSEKPYYQNGVESYVLSTRIQPIYVGFKVTWYSLKKAITVIKSKLMSILFSKGVSVLSDVYNHNKIRNDVRMSDTGKNTVKHQISDRGLKKLLHLFKSIIKNLLSLSALKNLLVSSLHYTVWIPVKSRLNPRTQYLTRRCTLPPSNAHSLRVESSPSEIGLDISILFHKGNINDFRLSPNTGELYE